MELKVNYTIAETPKQRVVHGATEIVKTFFSSVSSRITDYVFAGQVEELKEFKKLIIAACESATEEIDESIKEIEEYKSEQSNIRA